MKNPNKVLSAVVGIALASTSLPALAGNHLTGKQIERLVITIAETRPIHPEKINRIALATNLGIDHSGLANLVPQSGNCPEALAFEGGAALDARRLIRNLHNSFQQELYSVFISAQPVEERWLQEAKLQTRTLKPQVPELVIFPAGIQLGQETEAFRSEIAHHFTQLASAAEREIGFFEVPSVRLGSLKKKGDTYAITAIFWQGINSYLINFDSLQPIQGVSLAHYTAAFLLSAALHLPHLTKPERFALENLRIRQELARAINQSPGSASVLEKSANLLMVAESAGPMERSTYHGFQLQALLHAKLLLVTAFQNAAHDFTSRQVGPSPNFEARPQSPQKESAGDFPWRRGATPGFWWPFHFDIVKNEWLLERVQAFNPDFLAIYPWMSGRHLGPIGDTVPIFLSALGRYVEATAAPRESEK